MGLGCGGRGVKVGEGTGAAAAVQSRDSATPTLVPPWLWGLRSLQHLQAAAGVGVGGRNEGRVLHLWPMAHSCHIPLCS